VTVTAVNLAFSPAAVTVRANSTVTLTLVNQDKVVPHDIQVAGLFSMPFCAGPCTQSVTFTTGAPRTYTFICSVHPSDMVGTLRVQ
jgi:plastocyanin